MADTQRKSVKKSVPSTSSGANKGAGWNRDEVIGDYRLAFRSRQASVLGRREVLTGKAKFGIFGDGKEVPQMAAAKVFRKGDMRAGYYRDQTFMFALGMSNIREFFAQLYAHTDVHADPSSAGRSMNGHFATRSLNDDGTWRDLTAQYNSTSDVSPTGSQMPRLVGMAMASTMYRENQELAALPESRLFTRDGSEIAFGMIGNASCAQGMFWEAVNAVGVLKAPMILSIWDDGYGISVSNELAVTKNDVGALLQGFQRAPGTRDGFDVFVVKGWDYPALVETYRKAEEITRKEHIPTIIHVNEITQPQGHSTSGSHERYKSRERLDWERAHDCIVKMRQWMIDEGLATAEELTAWEQEEIAHVQRCKEEAWEAYCAPIKKDIAEVCVLLDTLASLAHNGAAIAQIHQELAATRDPGLKDVRVAIHKALIASKDDSPSLRAPLIAWRDAQAPVDYDRYDSHLYSETGHSALEVPEIPAVYSAASQSLQGFEILNHCFDAMLSRDPRVCAFGEDVGKLGDVNQAFMKLQAKYGPLRVFDTGIRETTIVGQAIGMALRGLRPIAEVQYLDYLLYALQIISDDLATLQYRTKGGQKAPVIVRTRGHRLEGIWHSGSPMGGIINMVRGVHVLVPRNMVQAAGFYNTVMRADDPAIVVEVLNGYRLKEQLPENIGEFTVPLGVPEVLRNGTDLTIVTYGACCRIALEAAETLAQVGIECEIIDVQSLLPFDRHAMIVGSIKRTGRVLFLDEDVPGGASAFMFQQVIEKQEAYRWLDTTPRTLTAKDHRPAYGSDGNYWSKPNAEDIFAAVYGMMNEGEPGRYPRFY
jgi:2-oxoisovalerate dehydrogenase E1 component